MRDSTPSSTIAPTATAMRHPILVAGFSLILARWLALSVPAVLLSTNLAITLKSVATAIAIYSGEALLLTASALLLWRLVLFAPLRILVTAATLVALAFLMFLSLSDPILQSIIGERLTPSSLRHYAGPELFLSNYFWAPVRTYWQLIGAAVAMLTVYLAWLGWIFVRKGLHPSRTLAPMWTILTLGVIGGILFKVPPALNLPYVLPPVEIAYVEEALGIDRTPLMVPERQAIERVRQLLGLPLGARWVSDEYPLVYASATAPTQPRRLPDVVMIIVESLRGANVSFINPDAEWTVPTPYLDAIAHRGVVFSRHISNGFPTGPGQIAAIYGAWPHLTKRIIAEFKSAALDGLPQRLRSLGYRSIHVEYNPGFDKNDAWISDVYDVHLDPKRDRLPGFERHLVDYAIRAIRDHDQLNPRPPLFLVFITANPHLPYQTPEEHVGRLMSGSSLSENYRTSVQSVDREVGRLVAFLQSRPSATDSLTVITGDHANFLDQKQTTSLPVNDTQWTGSIFVGPRSRIGPPRTSEEPASHTDLLPTILGFVGDRRPTASLGRDLFDPHGRPAKQAIAVRNGGTRFDSANGTMMLKRNDPALAESLNIFPPTKENMQPPAASLAENIALAARLWSFLLETDRAWSPSFLENARN